VVKSHARLPKTSGTQSENSPDFPPPGPLNHPHALAILRIEHAFSIVSHTQIGHNKQRERQTMPGFDGWEDKQECLEDML
jgi:hypothetical protein